LFVHLHFLFSDLPTAALPLLSYVPLFICHSVPPRLATSDCSGEGK
jgi:hypothetical protein